MAEKFSNPDTSLSGSTWIQASFPAAVVAATVAVVAVGFLAGERVVCASLSSLILVFLPIHGVGFGAFIFLVAQLKGNPLATLEFAGKTGRRILLELLTAIPVALGFLLISFILTLVATLVLRAIGITPGPSPFFAYMQGGRPLLLLAALIGVAVVAPVAEEILFRFGMFEFLKSFDLPAPAVFVAAVFAGIHGDLHALPALFFLSLLLQAARQHSNGMFAPVFIHAFYNLFSSLIFLVLHALGFNQM